MVEVTTGLAEADPLKHPVQIAILASIDLQEEVEEEAAGEAVVLPHHPITMIMILMAATVISKAIT